VRTERRLRRRSKNPNLAFSKKIKYNKNILEREFFNNTKFNQKNNMLNYLKGVGREFKNIK
jgi:hypothetical protein